MVTHSKGFKPQRLRVSVTKIFSQEEKYFSGSREFQTRKIFSYFSFFLENNWIMENYVLKFESFLTSVRIIKSSQRWQALWKYLNRVRLYGDSSYAKFNWIIANSQFYLYIELLLLLQIEPQNQSNKIREKRWFYRIREYINIEPRHFINIYFLSIL